MRAVLWSDYICPWAYAAGDRLRLVRQLGVDVTIRPYELHPEIGRAGIDRDRARSGGRTATLYARIAAECAEVGMAFNPPRRVPNSRLALEVAEHVRVTRTAAFETLHEALFAAHFVDGQPIDDPDVLRGLVEGAGVDGRAVLDEVLAGAAAVAVSESMAEAWEAGVTATPGFYFDDRLPLPGLQPREVYERIVAKLAATA